MRYNINKKKKLNLKNLVFLFYMFLSVLIMNLYKYKYIILVIIILFYLYLKYKSKIIEGFCLFNCGGKSREQREREEAERKAKEKARLAAARARVAAEKARQQKMRDEYAAKKMNSEFWEVSMDIANAEGNGATDTIISSVHTFCPHRVSAHTGGIATSGCI